MLEEPCDHRYMGILPSQFDLKRVAETDGQLSFTPEDIDAALKANEIDDVHALALTKLITHQKAAGFAAAFRNVIDPVLKTQGNCAAGIPQDQAAFQTALGYGFIHFQGRLILKNMKLQSIHMRKAIIGVLDIPLKSSDGDIIEQGVIEIADCEIAEAIDFKFVTAEKLMVERTKVREGLIAGGRLYDNRGPNEGELVGGISRIDLFRTKVEAMELRANQHIRLVESEAGETGLIAPIIKVRHGKLGQVETSGAETIDFQNPDIKELNVYNPEKGFTFITFLGRVGTLNLNAPFKVPSNHSQMSHIPTEVDKVEGDYSLPQLHNFRLPKKRRWWQLGK